MYKLSFFVPRTHLEQVKSAVFLTGAGKLGDYRECCWQSLGQGQFRPLSNSDPFIGAAGKLEYVEEYKVELVCKDELIKVAVEALKREHPYEEPAYDVVKLEAY